MGNWAAYPKLGIPGLMPQVSPYENTGLIISAPKYIAPAAQVHGLLSSASPI